MHKRFPLQLCETAILTLLAFVVFWKGGKTLESTWLLCGVGSLSIIILHFFQNPKELVQQQYDVWPIVILFILWTAASYIFSSTQNYGLDEVLRTAGLGFILLWYVQRPEKINEEVSFEKKFISIITFLTVIFCVIGTFIYIFQPVNRFVGTFFDIRFQTDYWPNAAAQYLLLAWPIMLLWCSTFTKREGSFFSKKRWKVYAIAYGPVGLALGGLFATYSRGALIAFIGQVVLLTILLLKQRGSVKTIILPLKIIGSALLIGLLFFTVLNGTRALVHPIQSISEKMTFSASEGRSSIRERISFWKDATEYTVKKPLLGWGPYSFRFIQPRNQHSVLATSDHPHNVFLKLSMERGVIAAFLFMAILYAVLSIGINLTLSGKRMSVQLDQARIGYSLLTISIAGVIAHNLIDYNLQFVGIALPFWILFAIMLRHSKIRKATQSISWLTQKYKTIFTSVLAFIILAVALREGYFLVTSSVGRHAESRSESDIAMYWYSLSMNEWFSRDMFLSMTHIALSKESIETASNTIRKYMVQNSEDARAWKLLAELSVLDNNFPDAIKAYEKAFALGGWNDLSISRGILESLFAQTFTQPTSNAAADTMRLVLDPRIAEIAPEIEERVLKFKDAILNNVHFVALSPNPEEAIKILITLSVIYPEKAEFYKKSMKEIDTKAKDERAKTLARSPGWLW